MGFPVWKERPRPSNSYQGWAGVTERIGHFIGEVTSSVRFDGVLVPRLQHMGLLEEKVKLQALMSTAQGRAEALTAEIEKAAAISARCEELSTLVRDRDSQIRALYESWSWRVTGPARHLIDIYQRSFRKK